MLDRGPALHQREGDAEGGAAAGGVGHLDRSVQRFDHGCHDRQSEARAPGLARARRVGAPEPLEDLLAQLLGHSLAVVDDGDPAHPGLVVDAGGELDRGAGGRVAAGVAEQVGDDLADAVLIAEHDRVARGRRAHGLLGHLAHVVDGGLRPPTQQRPGGVCDTAAAHGRGGRRRGRCRLGRRGGGGRRRGIHDRHRALGGGGPRVERGVARDRAQVDGRHDDVAPLVEAGEGEEVFDEAAHPDRLLLDPLHRLRRLLVARDGAHAVELRIAADGDERGAQLVARVADEPAHLLHGGVALAEGLVDAVEHRVDRGLQAPHLGAGGDVAHALAEVAGGDRHGGVLDLAEAAERQRDEPARREGAGEDRQEREDRVDADVVGDGLVDAREGERDHLRVVVHHPVDRRQEVGARMEAARPVVGLELEDLAEVRQRLLERERLGEGGGGARTARARDELAVGAVDRDEVLRGRRTRLHEMRHPVDDFDAHQGRGDVGGGELQQVLVERGDLRVPQEHPGAEPRREQPHGEHRDGDAGDLRAQAGAPPPRGDAVTAAGVGGVDGCHEAVQAVLPAFSM